MQVTSPGIRVLAAWLLGLLLAIAVAVLTVFLVNDRVFGPERQVRAYFEALSAGDGESALGILNARVPDANAAMLDGPALRQAADSLEDVDIGAASFSDDARATIEVNYTLAGKKAATTYLLAKTGTEWLFFDTWTFVPTELPTIAVSVVNQDTATLNGMPVATPGGQNTFAAFYPGEYESHYTSPYFAAPAQSTLVTSRKDKDRINLATKATDKLRADVGEHVREFLDQCATQKVLQPTGCPFYFDTENRIVGNIKWTISTYPQITIEPANGGWRVHPLSGTALLTTTEQNLFTGQLIPLNIETDFNFTTRLKVSDSSITVTPIVDY